ncbi:HEMGN protein, partial [Alectura lathami]|nr:HEMGN protein [Alectura lathami]
GPTISQSLRDRQVLQKRKAEAKERDATQLVMGEQKRTKRMRKVRGAKGSEEVVEPTAEAEAQRDPEQQSEPQTNAQPDSQNPGQDEPNPENPAPQAENPLVDIQDLFSTAQLGDLEGILGSASQSPLGEEDLMRLVDDIPEDFHLSLPKDEGDNEVSSTN